MKFLLYIVITLALLTSGCSTSDSEDYATREIEANMLVVADADESEVEVRLKADGHRLELTGDDKLTVTADGLQKTMRRNGKTYFANFTDKNESNIRYTVKFTRDRYTDATDNTVNLPAVPSVQLTDEPSENRDNIHFETTETFTLTWTRDSNTYLYMEYKVTCLNTADEEVVSTSQREVLDDDGDEEFLVSDLLGDTGDNTNSGENCDLWIQLTREYETDVDSDFDDGTFKATQKRDRTFYIDIP